MSANGKQKDDLRAYPLSTREFWGLYRTQKENAAWLAMALYLGGLAALVGLILQGNTTFLRYFFVKVWMFALAILTACCTYLFIQKQDRDRCYAANVSDACNSLLARLLKYEPNEEEYESAPYPKEENKDKCSDEERYFPKILADEIPKSCERLSDKQRVSNQISCWRNWLLLIWTVVTVLLLLFAGFYQYTDHKGAANHKDVNRAAGINKKYNCTYVISILLVWRSLTINGR